MATSASSRHSHITAGSFIVAIGLLVGGNFALAKYVVLSGISPLVLFEWQVLGAGLALMLGLALSTRAGLAVLTTRHVAVYCVVNGLIGVSAPQVLSYFALQQVPSGLFTMLVTLSPLLTFLLSSLVGRRLLPLRRLLGILIGLAGITIATVNGVTTANVGLLWLAAACCVPLLLAVTNVYRERAMPADSNPLVLAAGTLLSQAILFIPFILIGDNRHFPFQEMDGIALAVIGLCAVTALSYILTFELYRRTDGVGFSQVGYFVTLSGAVAGVVFFKESITPWFALSVILLFLGMAVTNGHISRKPSLLRVSGEKAAKSACALTYHMKNLRSRLHFVRR